MLASCAMVLFGYGVKAYNPVTVCPKLASTDNVSVQWTGESSVQESTINIPVIDGII